MALDANTINLIITILAPVLSSVLTVGVTFFLAKLVKKLKEGHKLDDETADAIGKVSNKIIKNSPVTLNTDKLIELMEDAESHPNFSSVEKLDYVLTSYQQYCMDNNFKFVKEVIQDAIAKLIDLTKNVNKRDKDQTTELIEGTSQFVNVDVPEPQERTQERKGIY